MARNPLLGGSDPCTHQTSISSPIYVFKREHALPPPSFQQQEQTSKACLPVCSCLPLLTCRSVAISMGSFTTCLSFSPLAGR